MLNIEKMKQNFCLIIYIENWLVALSNLLLRPYILYDIHIVSTFMQSHMHRHLVVLNRIV